MSPRRTFIWIILFVNAVCFQAESQNKNKLYLKYIDDYKDLAVEHQRKYQIPASITLSQGLLESGAGTGNLARKSNNHFGIKCHDWRGDRVYHDDDLKGECFRKYDHPKQSYEDHSLFLKKNSRYAILFELKTTDYKGWARGLQRCGYATDKAYASKLIQLIENYELYEYDQKGNRFVRKESVVNPLEGRHSVYKSSGLLYIEIKNGDNLNDISKELGLSVKKLCKYNEIPADFPLVEGNILYLEKKRKKAESPYLLHTISAGESMYSISQRYGIRVKYLYKMNKKDKDYVPGEGDILKLR